MATHPAAHIVAIMHAHIALDIVHMFARSHVDRFKDDTAYPEERYAEITLGRGTMLVWEADLSRAIVAIRIVREHMGDIGGASVRFDFSARNIGGSSARMSLLSKEHRDAFKALEEKIATATEFTLHTNQKAV